MTLTEEQRAAIEYAISSLEQRGSEPEDPVVAKILLAMIDGSSTVEPTGGFDLEKARAADEALPYPLDANEIWVSGKGQMHINPPNAPSIFFTLSDLCEFRNLFHGQAAEIERLRPFEIAARDLDSDLTKIAGERDDQAAQIKELEGMLSIRTEELDIAHSVARSEKEMHEKELAAFARRIKELEDALVEGLTNFLHYRASCYDPARRCPYAKECDDCSTWDACGHVEKFRSEARRRLQAEGKIGPDAKSVNKGNQCQYCKKCGRDMRFEFSIRDEIWNKLPKTWKDRVLCIECFLEELNEVEPDQEIHFDDFNYMCILDPIEDTEWKGDRPKLLHPLFGGTLIDAKNPLAWQITEERKAAIWHAVAVLKENDPDDEHLWDEEIAVLRAMLTEAE